MKLVALLLLVPPIARAEPWPRALIDRPLTLDHGLVELDLAAGASMRRVLGVDLDDPILAIGARWGAGERVELELATSFVADPDARWSGLVRGAVALRRRLGAIELAPTVRLDACGACGFSIFSTASLGAPLRWRASERIYLHAGRELLPWTIRPYLALDLSVRAGAGAQLTDTIAVELDAELARVTIAGQQRDDRWAGPAEVTALASVTPRVDVEIAIGADRAFDPADGWRAIVSIAARSR